MSHHEIVLELLYFLIAAVTFVPLFKLIGLGPVLGYLFAGIMIGPWAFDFLKQSNAIVEFSEVGVVFLFFIIGLEISPRRLIALKNKIFIYGFSQVVLTTSIFTFILTLFDFSMRSALIISFAMAISSTAYALNILKEKNEITYSYGQASMGILLFQDLAVIPVLALIPLISSNTGGDNIYNWIGLIKSAAIFLSIVVLGNFTLKPFICYIQRTQPNEIFISACLLIVLGTAIAMNSIGLSMGLGAFLAGVLLANSDVKHEIEKSILPFKTLLMGLFFMGIGLELNMNILKSNGLTIALITATLILIKSLVLFLVAKIQKLDIRKSSKLGIILCEAGEFSFIILTAAFKNNLLPNSSYSLFMTAAIISMFAAPILYALFSLFDKKHVAAEQVDNVIPLNAPKTNEQDLAA